MTPTRSILSAALVTLLAAGSLATAASAQDRWDWNGGRPGDGRAYRLAGPGVRMLLPELRDTRRGQAFVLRNFDFRPDGLIDRREASAANRAFLDAAGPNRGRFDWDRRPVAAPGGWDREGMRGYHFRQGRYGATFTLQDVLFQTGSAALRSGAEAQLRPLAGYLRANPGVELRIEGFTDSVGSPASNLTLSRDRAHAVASALEATGIDPARFRLEGLGEAAPVAGNDTADGRRLNRRVEVTLVGQKANAFE
jgi:outer membrane protein OmpA-like peptidoglycan-associated protein